MFIVNLSAIVPLVTCVALADVAAAQEVGKGSPPARVAPSGPMDFGEAARRWDGTGELLLVPETTANAAFAAALKSEFAIGATFDNSDAPKPEADPARSAFGRCASGIFPMRLTAGDIVIEEPLGDRWRKEPGISSKTDRSGITFQFEQCRYDLELSVKVPEEGGWVPPVRSVPPPPPPFTGKSIVLKLGETMTFKFPPVPAELSLYKATMKVGPYLPPALAAKCPRLAGSLWFEPQGVFVDMPWGEGDVVVPGLRRDPSERVTTLIFQRPECRLELAARREIQDDSGWHFSSLSSIPSESY